MLPRVAVVLAAGIGATGLGAPALASVLLPISATLGAGSTPVTSCGDLTSAVVRYAVTNSLVTAVTVAGLPNACNGDQLLLTLVTSGGSTSLGPTSIAGGSATLTIASNGPTSTSITEVRLAVIG